MVAVDSAGNESKPSAFVSGKYNKSIEAKWIEPKTKINKRKGTVELTWNPEDFIASDVMLYGKDKQGKWGVIKKVNIDEGKEVLNYNGTIVSYIFKVKN